MIKVISTSFSEFDYAKKHEDKVNAALSEQPLAKTESYIVQNTPRGDSKYVNHGQIVTIVSY